MRGRKKKGRDKKSFSWVGEKNTLLKTLVRSVGLQRFLRVYFFVGGYFPNPYFFTFFKLSPAIKRFLSVIVFFPSARSGKHLFYHMTMDIRQAEVAVVLALGGSECDRIRRSRRRWCLPTFPSGASLSTRPHSPDPPRASGGFGR